MASSKKTSAITKDQIDSMIRTVRGVRVMLDSDLAAIYGVPTKRLNEQVKRNLERFPGDFMFQLTVKESASLRSQIATGSPQAVDSQGSASNRSQTATGSQKHRDPRLRPYAFTEYGALMAANILSSPRAVQMSIFVVRAFAKMREAFLATPDLARKLAALEKKLTGRLNAREAAIVHVLQEIMQILNPFTLRDLKSRGSQQQLLADFEDYLNGFSENVQDIVENFKLRNQLPTLSKSDSLGTLVGKFLDLEINLSPIPSLTRTAP